MDKLLSKHRRFLLFTIDFVTITFAYLFTWMLILGRADINLYYSLMVSSTFLFVACFLHGAGHVRQLVAICGDCRIFKMRIFQRGCRHHIFGNQPDNIYRPPHTAVGLRAFRRLCVHIYNLCPFDIQNGQKHKNQRNGQKTTESIVGGRR